MKHYIVISWGRGHVMHTMVHDETRYGYVIRDEANEFSRSLGVKAGSSIDVWGITAEDIRDAHAVARRTEPTIANMIVL